MKHLRKEQSFDFSDTITDKFFTEDAIFFDIETTGFSHARTSLYLIGCAVRKGDTLCIDQYFAEEKTEEAAVIQAFFAQLACYQTMITFNGTGFDIPYLTGKCETLGIPVPFAAHPSLDIYKEAARQKALLGLASLKQKAIEAFLGIERKDMFSGGELIQVYKSYVKHHSDETLALLKQHNYEDVLYMPRLLPILSYREAFHAPLRVLSLEANETTAYDGHTKYRELIFTLENPYQVPKSLSYQLNDCYLLFRQTDIRLCVRLLEDELKYFFDNSTCHTKKYALFLPQYDKLFKPAFCRSSKDKLTYFELSEEFTASPVLQEQYVQHLMTYIGKNTAKQKK